MPLKCLVCRAEVGTTCKRSFHRFPKEDLLKQKWLDAINVSKTPNFNSALICSDHFDRESLSYPDEGRQRQRLYKGAVPNLTNTNAQNLLIKIETKETKEVEICANTDPSITSIETPEIDVLKDVSLPSSTKKLTETSTQALPLKDSEMLSGSTSDSKSNSRKRKRLINDNRIVKRVRFMSGFKTEYVRREDFVSDESWQRFLRYATYHRSTSAAASRRNSRKQKKIQNLTAVIENFNTRER